MKTTWVVHYFASVFALGFGSFLAFEAVLERHSAGFGISVVMLYLGFLLGWLFLREMKS